jgi:RHS repeat-associated protein
VNLLKLVPALLAAPLSAQYTYYYSDALTSVNSSNWQSNGAVTTGSSGLIIADANGGALISKLSPPTQSDYEVRATLNFAASGGVYSIFLRASLDTLAFMNGTYYDFEINPTFSGSNCSSSLYLVKSVNGSVSFLGMTTTPCHNGMQAHAVARGGAVWYYQDNTQYFWAPDNDIPSGQPGIGGRGMPAGSSISAIDLGRLDTTPPNPVNGQSIGVSSFPNRVDMHWQGVTDDANGIGLEFYWVQRDDAGPWQVKSPNFTDETVTPGSTHTYAIIPQDWHSNISAPVGFTVTTPPAGAIDSRRLGVHPLGSYWGGMGEQIDIRSGNLNFTVPILKAMGRGGWGVNFALSYNSQQWRQDPAGIWGFGQDVGYGFGWQFMAGSIEPYWSNYYTLHHYIFTDSTGTQYRLDINNNDIWTSREGIYVSYDAANQILYFPDGSFWTMGCTSAGNESDAGAMYPTQMEDTNGNQIVIRYATGVGVSWTNSSARMLEIEDVRAAGSGGATYSFSYDNNAVLPHLLSVMSHTATAEGAFLSYTTQNLYDPFTNTSFGTASMLTTLSSSGVNRPQAFVYDGAGEMTQVSYVFGGSLRWDYISNTYMGTRTQREVYNRYLRQSAGAAETGHSFSWHSDDPTRPTHAYTLLMDGAGNQKAWYLGWWGAGAWWTGLVTSYEERAQCCWQTPQLHADYTWTQDANGTPYIGATNTTLDAGTANAVTMRTEQTVDTHGNIVQTKAYDYAAGGNPGALLRTTTNSYASSSNYTSRYIFNRLGSTSVANGSGQAATVVSNVYDQYSTMPDTPGVRQHDSTYTAATIYRGNITSQTTPTGTVTHAYDIVGNTTTVQSGTGTVQLSATSATNYYAPSTVTPNSNSNLSSSFQFNGAMELTSAAMPNGATSSATYDGLGQPLITTSVYGAVTTYTYNYNGTASTVTATTVGDSGTRWVRSTMDGLGRTIKVEKGTGPTNNQVTLSVTESVYAPCACSPLGKVIQVSQPHAPNATPLWTSYTYDARGRTLTMVKPDGSTTSYAYAGNKTTVTDAAGNWKIFSTDGTGNLVQVVEPNVTNVSPGKTATQSSTLAGYSSGVAASAVDGRTDGNYFNGSVTHTNLDSYAWWQVDLGASASISSVTIWNRTDCCMDRLGDYWVFVSDTPFGSSDTPATLANRAGTWSSHQTNYPNPSTTVSPNAPGRYVRVQLSGSNYLSLAEVQVFTVNSAGAGTTITTSYSYNAMGKLTQVNMAGQIRTFTYDQGGQGSILLSATNPENGTVTYTYNSDGTLATKHDAKNQTIQYSYDNYKRLTQVTRPDSQDNYTYDTYSTSGFTSSYAWGRLAAVTFQGRPDANNLPTTFVNMYSYTPAGSVTAKRLRLLRYSSPLDLDANYSYDNEGHVTQLTYPLAGSNGRPVYGYGYDAMGRPNSVTQTGGPGANLPLSLATSVNYGPAGELLQINNGNGAGSTFESRTYNSLLQLTSINYYQPGGYFGTSLQYTYPDGHNIGKISSQTNGSTGEQVQYQYDALGRLTSAQTAGPDWGYSYRYDVYGTLQGKTVTKGNPTAGGTFLAATYDANGNMTGTNTQGVLYAYDAENRLTAYLSDAGEQYGYDPSNKRIQMQTTQGEEIHFYGAMGEQLGVYRLSGTAYGSGTWNVYFAGKLLVRSSSPAYVWLDRLGSDATIPMYPWGEERQTSTQGTEKFATYYRDNTGLDYADQRYYSSIMGRFLTPDPYKAGSGTGDPSNPQSWNRYAYASSDPVNFHDPHGLLADAADGYCPSEFESCGEWDWLDQGGGDGITFPCKAPAGFTRIPGTFCFLALAAAAAPVPAAKPIITLRETDDCIYPDGIGFNNGAWTLEIQYQVLVNGVAVSGNDSLNRQGISIFESVQKTSGNIDIGSGKWCPVGGNCSTAGSMDPHGMFWDVLSGNGTANQTFLFGGSPVSVGFPGVSGSQTVLKNTYNSSGKTISVGNGALTGTSATRSCGTKNGDPTAR